MPLQDEHHIEHPRVWQDRLPERFKERGPRIVEVDGHHVWHYDGVHYPPSGSRPWPGNHPKSGAWTR